MHLVQVFLRAVLLAAGMRVRNVCISSFLLYQPPANPEACAGGNLIFLWMMLLGRCMPDLEFRFWMIEASTAKQFFWRRENLVASEQLGFDDAYSREKVAQRRV